MRPSSKFSDVLARLLGPSDFGLVSMVTAFTGVLSLFRDFGLSAASVQRSVVTEGQTSTLFWVNILLGGFLTIVALALAPVVGAFYHEPRLFWITSVVAIGFVSMEQAFSTAHFSSAKCGLPPWY